MTVNLKFVQTPAVSLYTGMSSTDVTCQITPYPKDLDGNKLVITDFGINPTFTVDPKILNYEEINGFTGITDNGDDTATLTGLSRDLTSKYPYTTTGTGKPHGSSAVVVFSDNPQIFGRLAGKENDERITGQWEYVTPPTIDADPVGDNDAVRRSWVLANLPAGAVSVDKIRVAGTAGATVAPGKLVYLDPATGTWKLSNAGATATIDNLILGIAQGIATSGNTIPNGVLLQGLDSNQSGLTANVPAYGTNVSGGIGSSAGTVSVVVGIALSTTSIMFMPRYNTTITALEKAATTVLASAGTTGTGAFLRGSLLKYGGTGSDGVLTATSGITSIDLGGARVFVKNYSSISITGTGSIKFINPHASGTFILIKCQTAPTFTSSTVPFIDASGCGAAGAPVYNVSGGGGATVTSGVNGTNGQMAFNYIKTNTGISATGSAVGTGGALATLTLDTTVQNTYAEYFFKYYNMFVGAGGANGGGAGTSGSYNVTSNAGGFGGGALVLEINGAWNYTTAGGISVAGTNGGNGVINGGSTAAVGGSSGGAGGSFLALVTSITANTGTITVSGGTGGNSAVAGGVTSFGGGSGASYATTGSSGSSSTSNGTKTGADGAVGLNYGVNLNTEFV